MFPPPGTGFEPFYCCRIAGFDVAAAPLPAMGAKLTLCRGIEQFRRDRFVVALRDLERQTHIAPQQKAPRQPAGGRPHGRGKVKEERGKRKEERGKRKEERGKPEDLIKVWPFLSSLYLFSFL
jgi:hypothetical protein